jgi:hypothetical protein
LIANFLDTDIILQASSKGIMKRIEFDPEHEKIFTQNCFNAFEDFIDCSKGQMINQNKKRNVSILRLPSQNGQKVYFIKRFFSPYLKDMLFTFRNFGKLCSQAELELRNVHLLLNNGIETYHPVCWGTHTFCGIERCSFFVTEKIQGRSLIEFLFDHWDVFDTGRHEKLVFELARFFRKLHSARLSLPDSYLWHLFLLEPIDMRQYYRFAIIDLHRMQINSASPRHVARTLGSLLFSLPEEWFDARLRNLFVKIYLESSGANPITNQRAFMEILKKREHNLRARRKKPDLEYLKMMV